MSNHTTFEIDFLQHLDFVKENQGAIFNSRRRWISFAADPSKKSPGITFPVNTQAQVTYELLITGKLVTGTKAFVYIESKNPRSQLIPREYIFYPGVEETLRIIFTAISEETTVSLLFGSGKVDADFVIKEMLMRSSAKAQPSVQARAQPSVTARAQPSVTARAQPSVTARAQPLARAQPSVQQDNQVHSLKGCCVTYPIGKVGTFPEEPLQVGDLVTFGDQVCDEPMGHCKQKVHCESMVHCKPKVHCEPSIHKLLCQAWEWMAGLRNTNLSNEHLTNDLVVDCCDNIYVGVAGRDTLEAYGKDDMVNLTDQSDPISPRRYTIGKINGCGEWEYLISIHNEPFVTINYFLATGPDSILSSMTTFSQPRFYSPRGDLVMFGSTPDIPDERDIIFDLCIASASFGGDWRWVAQISGISGFAPISTDNRGNVYVTMITNLPVVTFYKSNFAGQDPPTREVVFTASGPPSRYVAKISPEGNWLWGGAAQITNVAGIASTTAGNGDTYLSLRARGTELINFVNPENISQLALGGSVSVDRMIAKINSAGNWQWWIRFTQPFFEVFPQSLTTSLLGGVYFASVSTATTQSTISGNLFPEFTVDLTTGITICKINPENGKPEWFSFISGTIFGSDDLLNLKTTIDSCGNLYVTTANIAPSDEISLFSANATVPTFVIPAESNLLRRVILGKLSPDGVWLWFKTVHLEDPAQKINNPRLAANHIGDVYFSASCDGSRAVATNRSGTSSLTENFSPEIDTPHTLIAKISDESRSSNLVGVVQDICGDQATVTFQNEVCYTPPKTELTVTGPGADIPDPVAHPDLMGPADPFPIRVEVEEICGVIKKIQVALLDLRTEHPNDLHFMLQGPNGLATVLYYQAGGNQPLNIEQILFCDQDPCAIPLPMKENAKFFTNRIYRTSTTTKFSGGGLNLKDGIIRETLTEAFVGSNPSGEWRLYIFDTNPSDSSSLGEFTLEFIVQNKLIPGKDYFIQCYSGTNMDSCVTTELCDNQGCRRRYLGTACAKNKLLLNIEPPLRVKGDAVSSILPVEQTNCEAVVKCVKCLSDCDRTGINWSQFTGMAMQIPETQIDDFGISVDSSGDWSIIGTFIPIAQNIGYAYIYFKNGLVATLSENSPRFGRSVRIQGDMAFVASNDFVWIYQKSKTDDSIWDLVKSIPKTQDFIADIRISGNFLVVREAMLSPGESKRLSLYARNQGGINVWGELQTFDTLAGISGFDICGDVFVYTLFDFDQNIVIYIYNLGTGLWEEQQTINDVGLDLTVALSAERIVIGAPEKRDSDNIITQNEKTKIYLRECNGTHWTLEQTLPHGPFTREFNSIINGLTITIYQENHRIVLYQYNANDQTWQLSGEIPVNVPPPVLNIGREIALDGNKLIVAYVDANVGTAIRYCAEFTCTPSKKVLTCDYQTKELCWIDSGALQPPPVDVPKEIKCIPDCDRTGINWSQFTSMIMQTPDNPLNNFDFNLTNFGRSVDSSGDWSIIGTFILNVLIPGLIPGIAYIYFKNQIVATLAEDSPRFGRSVRIQGDLAFVASNEYVWIYQKSKTDDSIWDLVKSIPKTQDFIADINISGNFLVVREAIIITLDSKRLSLYARNQGGINVWGEIQTIETLAAIAGFDICSDILVYALANLDKNIVINIYNPGTGLWEERQTINNVGFRLTVGLSDDRIVIGVPQTIDDDIPQNEKTNIYVRECGGTHWILEQTLSNGPFNQTGYRSIINGSTIAIYQQNQIVLYQYDANAQMWELVGDPIPVIVALTTGREIALDGNKLIVAYVDANVGTAIRYCAEFTCTPSKKVLTCDYSTKELCWIDSGALQPPPVNVPKEIKCIPDCDRTGINWFQRTFMNMDVPNPISGAFGISSDISGDWSIIGDDVLETAYIYFRERLITTLSGPENSGTSVQIQGDLAVVASQGCVDIYQKSQVESNMWNLEHKIMDGATVVSLSGTTLAVRHSDTLIRVYERNQNGSSQWGSVAQITDSDIFDVAICGDVLAYTTLQGRLVIWTRNLGWNQHQMINLEVTNIYISVSISDTRIVVGISKQETRIYLRDCGARDWTLEQTINQGPDIDPNQNRNRRSLISASTIAIHSSDEIRLYQYNIQTQMWESLPSIGTNSPSSALEGNKLVLINRSVDDDSILFPLIYCAEFTCTPSKKVLTCDYSTKELCWIDSGALQPPPMTPVDVPKEIKCIPDCDRTGINWAQVTDKVMDTDSIVVFGDSSDISGDWSIISGDQESHIYYQTKFIATLTDPGEPDIIELQIQGDLAIVASVDNIRIYQKSQSDSSDWTLQHTINQGADVVSLSGTTLVARRTTLVVYERNQGGFDQWGSVVEIQEDTIQDVAICGDVFAYTRQGELVIWTRDGEWKERQRINLNVTTNIISVSISDTRIVVGISVEPETRIYRRECGSKFWTLEQTINQGPDIDIAVKRNRRSLISASTISIHGEQEVWLYQYNSNNQVWESVTTIPTNSLSSALEGYKLVLIHRNPFIPTLYCAEFTCTPSKKVLTCDYKTKELCWIDSGALLQNEDQTLGFTTNIELTPKHQCVVFEEDSTWTVPDGTSTITVTLVGGGGGGGIGNADSYGGGGGGSGRYRTEIVPVIPGDTFQIHIGAGGKSQENGGDTYIRKNPDIFLLVAGGDCGQNGYHEHGGGDGGDGGSGGGGGAGDDAVGLSGKGGQGQFGHGSIGTVQKGGVGFNNDDNIGGLGGNGGGFGGGIGGSKDSQRGNDATKAGAGGGGSLGSDYPGGNGFRGEVRIQFYA